MKVKVSPAGVRPQAREAHGVSRGVAAEVHRNRRPAVVQEPVTSLRRLSLEVHLEQSQMH